MLSSIVVMCPADTNAHALKSVLFITLVPKFPQLKDIQDRWQLFKKNRYEEEIIINHFAFNFC